MDLEVMKELAAIINGLGSSGLTAFLTYLFVDVVKFVGEVVVILIVLKSLVNGISQALADGNSS